MRYAIILTHNRPQLLQRCLEAIIPQVDRIWIVDNASDPVVARDPSWLSDIYILHIHQQPPNIAAMWNKAFSTVDLNHAWSRRHQESYDLAVLCDDAIVPAGWFYLVSAGMRKHGAAAAATGSVTAPILKTVPDHDIANRMPGWAFMLAGEKHLRADERLKWWWCDTDLDWKARSAGGMVLLPGPVVPNEGYNEYTAARPELMQQSGVDGETFKSIHGWRPW